MREFVQRPLRDTPKARDAPVTQACAVLLGVGWHAHVHRNTPTARPQAPQLQKYLQDMVRVLTVATEMTGDEKRAAVLLRNEPLRAFGYKTADTLIREGQADAVIAYLESLASGAAG